MKLVTKETEMAILHSVLQAYPLLAGGETGDSDGQTLFGGGSSSCSSSEELSSVRSITSTFLLLS